MSQTHRRRRQQIDPKTLKKHSQIVKRQTRNVVVLGQKEKTSTGFIIPGHKGKAFETYFETLLAGTASDMVRHPTKDRVIRVVSGDGFVILDDGINARIDKRIQAGDELILKAGVAYRFTTTSNQNLELYVSQEAKYFSRLKMVEESTATTEVTVDMLQENQRNVIDQPARRGSKARQQQARKNSKRMPTGQVFDTSAMPVGPAEAQQTEGVATASSVMNARPSHGRFDDSSAG